MGSLQGSGSLSLPIFGLASGNDAALPEYLGTNYSSVIPLINAAIGDGLKVARVVQAATTVTQTYDMQSVTATGEAAATVFTVLRHIIVVVTTAYATNVSVAVNPKDGVTGLLGPWGSAYSATSYSTAYGPNASNKNLASPLILSNNGPGWTIDATHKDINVDPGSTATGWVIIFIGS